MNLTLLILGGLALIFTIVVGMFTYRYITNTNSLIEEQREFIEEQQELLRKLKDEL